MRKALSYILPLIAAFFCLIPPIDFALKAPDKNLWPLTMVCAAFLGIRMLFVRTNWIVRLAPTVLLINCFLSGMPVVSFNAYPPLLACAYFYVALTRMETWRPTWQMLGSLLVLNSLLLLMQVLGHDRLLNFGRQTIEGYGVIGQHMQMGSFSVILSAVLGATTPLFYIFAIVVGIYCKSSWTLLCAGLALAAAPGIRRPKILGILAVLALAGFFIMATKTGKFSANTHKDNGRSTVWMQSIEMSNERPIRGWGISTYQWAGPVFVKVKGIPWKQTHNDWIQLDVELGHPIFFLFVMAWAWVLAVLISKSADPQIFKLTIGYLVISLDMVVHFPLRIIQCAPLIIIFLAYCEKKIRET